MCYFTVRVVLINMLEIFKRTNFFSILFKQSVFLNIKQKGWQPIVYSSPNQLLVVLLRNKQEFLVKSKLLNFSGVSVGSSYYGVGTK